MTMMAPRITTICLLLLAAALRHHRVTSFAVHRRHSRSVDLADALRMLERQRRRSVPQGDGEDGGNALLAGGPRLLDEGGLTLADLEPWFSPAGQNEPSLAEREEEEVAAMKAEWLARSLGLDDDYGEVMRGWPQQSQQSQEPLLPPALPPAPQQVVKPSDQELDAIFDEKNDDDDTAGDEVDEESVPPSALKKNKKDKEVMTDVKGDANVNVAQTRDVSEGASSENSDDDVSLTNDEFKALLKAVKKLQKQAIDNVVNGEEEAQEVAAEVAAKVAQAREDAKEDAVDQGDEEEAEREKKSDVLTPNPQPVSNEELDSLFEDKSQQVIPTNNGEIVKTEKVLKDSEGQPVGEEETVESVQTFPNKASLSSIEDFWYLRNYLDQDGERKKRNSKRNSIPETFSGPEALSRPDTMELLGAYINKINQQQTELDKLKLIAYLEDLENDVLTEALNQATVSQMKGRIQPAELGSLQQAIRVEEALQTIKSSRSEKAKLADDLARALRQSMEAAGPRSGQRKRGEPWRKRTDTIPSQIPVYIADDSGNDNVMAGGDNDDVIDDIDDDGGEIVDGDDVGDDDDDDDDIDDGDSDEESTALALRKMLDEYPQMVNLDDLLDATGQDMRFEDKASSRLMGGSRRVASLFSSNADQCPAVREYSTNCQFAGDSIDFEARALCNIHEMCYVCGQTLGVEQKQCDFIYREASSMLCQGDTHCVVEAEAFLNSMKLKHRYVPYPRSLCQARCMAQFLSIV